MMTSWGLAFVIKEYRYVMTGPKEETEIHVTIGPLPLPGSRFVSVTTLPVKDFAPDPVIFVFSKTANQRFCVAIIVLFIAAFVALTTLCKGNEKYNDSKLWLISFSSREWRTEALQSRSCFTSPDVTQASPRFCKWIPTMKSE
jgi:hypothetical protein